MTGGVGGDTSLVSVEVLKEDGSPWCSLPDFPDNRHLHSQTGLLHPYNRNLNHIPLGLVACGGFVTNTTDTCLTFTVGGEWTQTHLLLYPRYEHVRLGNEK